MTSTSGGRGRGTSAPTDRARPKAVGAGAATGTAGCHGTWSLAARRSPSGYCDCSAPSAAQRKRCSRVTTQAQLKGWATGARRVGGQGQCQPADEQGNGSADHRGGIGTGTKGPAGDAGRGDQGEAPRGTSGWPWCRGWLVPLRLGRAGCRWAETARDGVAALMGGRLTATVWGPRSGGGWEQTVWGVSGAAPAAAGVRPHRSP